MVVSAGGTREALDPVRFLGNASSGKQGFAIARAAAEAGAKVAAREEKVNLIFRKPLKGDVQVQNDIIEDLVGKVTFGNVWALLVDGRFGPGLPPAESFPIPVPETARPCPAAVVLIWSTNALAIL